MKSSRNWIRVLTTICVCSLLILVGCCKQQLVYYFAKSPIPVNTHEPLHYFISSVSDSCLVLSIEKTSSEGADDGARIVFRERDGSSAQIWKTAKNPQGGYMLESAVRTDMVLGFDEVNGEITLTLQRMNRNANYAWANHPTCIDSVWVFAPGSAPEKAMSIGHSLTNKCAETSIKFRNFEKEEKKSASDIMFRFERTEPIEKPIYTVKHQISSGMVYTISGHFLEQNNKFLSAVRESNEVKLSSDLPHLNNLWRAIDQGGGFFTFESLSNEGWVIEWMQNGGDSETIEVRSFNNGNDNQLWQPRLFETRDGDDYIILRNKADLSKVIHLPNNVEGKKSSVEVQELGFSSSQKLKFEVQSNEILEQAATILDTSRYFSMSQGFAISGFMTDDGIAFFGMLPIGMREKTQWQFIPREDGWGVIVPKSTNAIYVMSAMDCKTSENDEEVAVGLLYNQESDAQFWRPIVQDGGRMKFECKAYEGKYLNYSPDHELWGNKSFLAPSMRYERDSWAISYFNTIPDDSVDEFKAQNYLPPSVFKFAPLVFFDDKVGEDDLSFPGNAQHFYECNKDKEEANMVKDMNQSYETIKNGEIPVYVDYYQDCFSEYITYWFWYGWQSACYVDHVPLGIADGWEGWGGHLFDWERVTVRVDNGRIHSVRYWQHGCYYTKKVANVGLTDYHPHVHVGRHSHGSYHNRTNREGCLYWDDSRDSRLNKQKMETWLNLENANSDIDADWKTHDFWYHKIDNLGPFQTWSKKKNPANTKVCKGVDFFDVFSSDQGCLESDYEIGLKWGEVP